MRSADRANIDVEIHAFQVPPLLLRKAKQNFLVLMVLMPFFIQSSHHVIAVCLREQPFLARACFQGQEQKSTPYENCDGHACEKHELLENSPAFFSV